MAQYRGAWLIGLTVVLLGALAPGVASAQRITTDGSLGTKTPLFGPNYTIPATLGQQVGGNLFHSFSIFGLGTGDTATFTNTLKPNTVNNVIGRVTGGLPSAIDGAIKTDPATLSGASLYLINPSGIIFGPNATVNVSGSFHASTASYVRASDGTFQANKSSASTFKAAPAAFGFLNATPGAITVNGSRLGVNPGQTIGLVGGPVTIQSSAGNGANLTARAGKIHLAAVAGPGEIPVDPTDSAGVTVAKLAPVNITGSSVLRVSDPTNHGSGGGIFIRAGSLTISASELDGDNYGTGAGGDLALNASGLVDLSNFGYVHAIAQSSGPGAPIAIAAGALNVASGAAVWSGTNAAGAGGPLNLSLSGGLSLLTGGRVVSDTEGTGSGGAITVLAGGMTIDGAGAPKGAQTGIISQTGGASAAGTVSIATHGTLSINGDPAARSCFDCSVIGSQSFGAGATGPLFVSAPQILITNGGAIATDSFTGDTGAVTVTASATITLLGGPVKSHISADAEGGAAGKVVVDAGGNLTISGASYISADTLGSGKAGTVQVSSGGDLALSAASITADSFSGADAGTVTVSAGGGFTLARASHVSADASLTGNAGTVTVTVGGDLSLSDATRSGGSYISAQNFGGGSAGSVTVTVGGNLALADASAISTDTFSGGPAGMVRVSVTGDLTLSDAAHSGGSQIAADTLAGGTAGGVSVAVGGNLLQTGGSFISADALAKKGGTEGRGGTVHVSAQGDAMLSLGSYISADSFFSGSAGTVTLAAQNLTMAGILAGLPSEISADSFEGGTAGHVALTVNGKLSLADGAYVTADALNNKGNGGTVRATIVGDAVLSNGSHFSANSFGGGNAGTVDIGVSGSLSLLTTAFISADSLVGGGNAGKVTVAVGGNLLMSDTSLSGGSFISADALFSQAIGTKCPTPATCPTGNAGNVTIAVQGDTTLTDGSYISTDAFVGGLGGSVTLAAHNLALDQGAYISADSLQSSGQAGDVTVTLGGNLSLIDSASISTQSDGAGNAGNVVITVAGAATVTGSLAFISSDTQGGAGNGGSVIVTAGSLTLANNGVISGSTMGAGKGGDVVVTAPDFTIADGGVIFADTLGTGRGGNVTVRSLAGGAGVLAIDGALIFGSPPTGILARAQPGSSGAAGTITIQADALSVVNGGIISTSTRGSGNAGQVVVGAGTVSLSTGGTISTDTLGAGSGNAGEVVVNATGAVSLDGGATAISSKSTIDAAGSQSNGNAGTVTVSAATLSLADGADILTSSSGQGRGGDVRLNLASDIFMSHPGTQISAGSSGTGDAGSITITAVNLRMTNHAAISTASATANGGNITLHVQDLMFLTDSKVTTSVAKGFGNGGNITIDPIVLVLLRSEIIAQAQQGNGGNITILADEFFESPDSLVSASSALGISGTIDIVGPRTDLNGSLAVLSSELRGAAEVLRNSCAARSALPRSSLTEAGRGGLPQDPETTIPALYLAGREADLSGPTGAALPAAATRRSELRLTMHCGA